MFTFQWKNKNTNYAGKVRASEEIEKMSVRSWKLEVKSRKLEANSFDFYSLALER